MREKTGGAAFPTPRFMVDDESRILGFSIHTDGMSLRDYFAAKVMQTICREVDDEGNYWLPHQVAELAYDQADAMLKARDE
jgi:hypothetical protein